MSLLKIWNFLNLKTPIFSDYCPTCFLWGVDQFLYITYESFKLQTVKRVKKWKKPLPKDEICQIWKHRSPLSNSERVSSEMLNNFYIQHESFKLSIVKKVKWISTVLPKDENF